MHKMGLFGPKFRTFKDWPGNRAFLRNVFFSFVFVLFVKSKDGPVLGSDSFHILSNEFLLISYMLRRDLLFFNKKTYFKPVFILPVHLT